jgi:2'-hydroxyisoflavone reductase
MTANSDRTTQANKAQTSFTSNATSRRTFLAAGALAAAAATPLSALASRAFGHRLAQPEGAKGEGGAGKKLKILILGGTGFLGPACVDAAQARGHTLTLFNRGVTEKRKGGMFPEIEKLVGDRDPNKGEGLKALEGRTWDAVIDTSAYVPRIAKASAELLAKSVAHYTMISTVSVYKFNNKANEDESGEIGTMADPTVEDMGKEFENYGPLKALCEKAAEAAMPGRVCNIRPGFIVGPGDPTPRFSYWPARVAKGGNIAVPGTASDPVRVIDVRDLGEWIIHVIEQKITGTFNAIGPKGGMTMGQMVEGIKKGLDVKDATFTYVPIEALEKAQVAFPIWVPPVGDTVAFHTRSGEKAFQNGLKSRTIEDTAKATYDWLQTLTEDRRVRLTGAVTAEQEQALLAGLGK